MQTAIGEDEKAAQGLYDPQNKLSDARQGYFPVRTRIKMRQEMQLRAGTAVKPEEREVPPRTSSASRKTKPNTEGRTEEARARDSALKEQSKDYERFVKDVQETTGRFIFDVLSGRIQSFKDLLGTVKDSFLKLLSDMAAAALARPIALMLTTQRAGSG